MDYFSDQSGSGIKKSKSLKTGSLKFISKNFSFPERRKIGKETMNFSLNNVTLKEISSTSLITSSFSETNWLKWLDTRSSVNWFIARPDLKSIVCFLRSTSSTYIIAKERNLLKENHVCEREQKFPNGNVRNIQKKIVYWKTKKPFLEFHKY